MKMRCLESGDAYLDYDAEQSTWSFGTNLVEQRLQLSDGRLRCIGLVNKHTGSKLVEAADSDEFYFTLDDREYSGLTGPYQLADYRCSAIPTPKSSPGTDSGVHFELILSHQLFQITLRYDIFASTPRTELGFIRKDYTVTNLSERQQPLTMISLQQLRLPPEWIDRLSICYWQGGGADAGTNEMRVEPPYRSLGRTFSSLAGMPGYRIDDIYDGSASFHPYFVLDDIQHHEGLYIGHNYLGPWSVRMMNAQQPILAGQDKSRIRHCYYINAQLEMHTEPLASGASFTTPNSYLGVYDGDLDTAAEQLHDWQATFKWDYTRERYLWGGSIYNSYWNDKEHRCNLEKRKDDMWQIANLCRSTGCKIAHEDDFWFDERGRGDWEGIEWAELVSYLKRSGINFKLWMPPQHFDPNTTLDREHPDWQPQTISPRRITSWYGHGFCPACQEAHDYMREFILGRQRRYGSYIHRFDGWVESPCFSESHDHPVGQPFVQQYRHYLDMMREAKDADPDLGLEGCNSGGEWCDLDKLALLEDNQHSDGGGPDDFYYLSYFWTPAKSFGLAGGGHKLEPEWIEKQRQGVLLGRYLVQKGVIGRFMRLYHPRAEGAPDSHTFIQVTNADRSRALLQADQACGEVTVYPKRLQPQLTYQVCWAGGVNAYSASGEELMTSGIRYTPQAARERVFLNLGDHPGAGTDHEPPTKPQLTVQRTETIWGHTGVALEWSPSTDNGILAGYEIWRNGKQIDFVAIGTFYFDCQDGWAVDASYQVVAVDGDGNRSA
ncbi:MAG: alpha-galactosidase [Anaerolineae bacterium]